MTQNHTHPVICALSGLRLRFLSFVTLYCGLTLLLFQKPLMEFVWPRLGPFGWNSLTLLASTQIIQICALFFVLGLVALVSVRAMKAVCILLLFGNAAAAYFMSNYGVELDRTMMGNVLATDSRESTELMHPELFLYLGVLAVIPSYFICCIKIDMPRWWVRLATPLVSLLVFVVWAFATAPTWFWFDRHGHRLGARVLPWSYVVNTARYLNHQSLINREQELLPEATFSAAPAPGTRQIVVLVIGEAARAQNFAHFGYARDTNPYTRDLPIALFPGGSSCATYTVGALACMLTHEGNAASPRTSFEPLQSYLTRHGVETIFRSNNFGEPPVKVSRYEKVAEIEQNCTGAGCPTGGFDGTMLYGLEEMLTQSTSDRIFVTLHQTGSHGPAYSRKYPPDFGRFQPTCDTVQIAECSSQELVNAYDNTILYTDFLIAELINQLARVENAETALIYLSDHGQSLGENGLYLHGSPIAIAPDVQRKIPFMAWMSPAFQAAHGLTPADIQGEVTNPQDRVFHSVMGAFGMASDIYRPEFDLFSTGYRVGQGLAQEGAQ